MHLSLLHSLAADVEVDQQKSGKLPPGSPPVPVDGSLSPSSPPEPPTKKSTVLRVMLKENCPPEAPHVKWALASPAAREKIERDAIIANITRQNHKKIAEERGTPFDTFHRIWREHTETRQCQGTHHSLTHLRARASTHNSPFLSFGCLLWCWQVFFSTAMRRLQRRLIRG